MAEQTTIGAEDLLPVHSRVSWGAIFAGAVLTLALYLVLTLLGSAIGLSVSDRVRGENLATGAAIWAVVSTALALFVGGWITAQLTVGENKLEAALHGVILWGVVFAAFLWLVSTGVRSGFNALVGMSQAVGQAAPQDWEAAARRAGVSQDQIDNWRRTAKEAPEAARRGAEDPQNQQAAADAATRVAWWTLAGTLLSMLAAVAGALVGGGPTLRLVRRRRTGPGTPPTAHQPTGRM